VSNLNFTNTPLQKLLNKRNIFSRVDALEAKDEAPSLTAESLGEITPDAGDIYVTNITNVIDNSVIGTPGGATTNIQFNNAGAFGGTADLTWDDATKILQIIGSVYGVYTTGFLGYGGDAPAASGANGGTSAFAGGVGDGAGVGGNSAVSGGAGGLTGAGGAGSVGGGKGGDTSGDGGAAYVRGAGSNSGTGGAVEISSGSSLNGTGGAINVTLGSGTASDGIMQIGNPANDYIQITHAGALSFGGDAHINFRVRIVTANTTQVTGDYLIIANKATAMSVTLLPATGSGQVIVVKSIGAGAVTVTADATGTADSIDGLATQVIGQWDSIMMMDYIADKWVIL
jgi:hypothetical protein